MWPISAVTIGLVSALLLQPNTGGVYSQCIDGDIRTDPSNSSIIQVCLDDEWGYVCGSSSGFSTEDVTVACNQLGNKSDENSFITARFSSPLLDSSDEQYAALKSFYCTGLESRLIDCPIHSVYSTSQACKKGSNSYFYGAVDCTSEEIECINGEIHEGEEGAIEVCTNGEFRLLCGDPGGWNDKDAMTACRELGYNPYGARAVFTGIPMDSNSPFPVRFHCTGYEDVIADCPRQMMSKCGVTTVAILSCGDQLVNPVITNIAPREDYSQLTITWSSNGQPLSEDYQYGVSCTSTDESQTITFQTITASSTTTFTGLSSNNWYNCCVAIVAREGSEPATFAVCEDYFIPSVDRTELSCPITVDSTSSSSIVRSTDTPTSTRTTAQQIIEDYGPWGYGFIIGLAVGVLVMMAICGCCMAVCLRRAKQQQRKTQYDLGTTGFVSVNAHASPHTNNPLYSMTGSHDGTSTLYNSSAQYEYDQQKTATTTATHNEKKLLSNNNEYDYSHISARPLPNVPPTNEQISPYLTTTLS